MSSEGKAAKTPPKSRWTQLTDEQLLQSTFHAHDPSALENVRIALPETSEVPEVEFTYNTKHTSGRLARCIHCKRDNHHKGFVLIFRDGTRILVGRICGFNIYGADFGVMQKDFERALDRHNVLRRRAAVLRISANFLQALDELRSDEALRKYREAKKLFNRDMRHLSAALADACSRGGNLSVEDQVRDLEAEAHRDEIREIADTRAGISISERRPGKPIFKTMMRPIGTVAGQEFFKIDRKLPDTILDEAAVRAMGLLASLSKDDGVLTSKYKNILMQISDLIDEIEGELRRLHSLDQAFEPENLALLARWANAGSIGRKHYSAVAGALRCADGDAEKMIAKPAEYLVPRPPALDEARQALSL
ncbi:MAG: hypothetical protein QOH65_2922 [Methylobacteriaceae bacterium]|jgi:hypothetical protein|nr:hypothetical protein [Methylobacteriaceae bacterium]